MCCPPMWFLVGNGVITPSVPSTSLFNRIGHRISKSRKEFMLLLFDSIVPLKISVHNDSLIQSSDSGPIWI